MEYFLQQAVNGVALGSVYALLALGVTLVWGVLNVLNFSHGMFVTWGAFGTFYAMSSGLPAWLAIVVGLSVGALLAVALERLVLTPLRAAGATDEFSQVVATIGVSMVLLSCVRWAFGSEIHTMPTEGFPSGSLELAGITIPRLQLLVLVSAVLTMVALGLFLARMRLGREIRAVAFSSEIAQLLGINARRVYVTAFAVSGALAALAGTFVAVQARTLSYSTGDTLLTLTFAAVVVGGMGSVKGAVVGGLILGIGEVLLGAYATTGFNDAIPYVLMAAVLLLKPQGLFAAKEVARV